VCSAPPAKRTAGGVVWFGVESRFVDFAGYGAMGRLLF